MKRLVLLLLILSVAALPVLTQESTVTDDQVNAIAKKLFCPVCENIPLDTCGTAACDDWRYEIRLQLEAGYTEQQIVDDFINRFGDRVVGTPRDPVLRYMSLVTPWLLTILAAGVGLFTLMRWTRNGSRPSAGFTPTPTVQEKPDSDDYRAWLENDLQEGTR